MSPRRPRPRGRHLFLGVGAGGLVALTWPAAAPRVDVPAEPTAFRWDADGLFAEMEAELGRAAGVDRAQAGDELDALNAEGARLLGTVAGAEGAAPLPALDTLATLQFRAAVLGAAHPTLLPSVLDQLIAARTTVMRSAAAWPLDRAAHEGIYRVVFGGRIALDEALAQAGLDALPELVWIEDVPSATPSVVVEGVRIHSGDILLSRGGAPTSALIARGNDFPNTFSHAALAHVDPTTGEATVVEALIEAGSVLSSVSEYLESKKHRILVLRLRPTHPAVARDPLLPHRAAESMLARVRNGHIPYDFAMDWRDDTAAFCSEIIFHAYREQGVELWTLRSAMSAPGLARWLTDMGVRELTTLVPSDLELDPQVAAAVEWRNGPALMDYRLDNAITDALLEDAERGVRLGFAWYALPGARLLKAYSVGQSAFGVPPTIPEGMSAATALRVNALVTAVHPVLREDLVRRGEAFRAARGFEAPYWVLVEEARRALELHRETLGPALSDG